MKPIIVDMKDMSDSTEVYESKPNRFLIYTIYLIFFILVAAILWMSLSKMDIVVKSNGMFKGSNAVYEISSGVTGSVTETHIGNGQYVEEGDVLYVLNIEELSDTILRYQTEFEAAKDRLEILSAYEKSLDGEKEELTACVGNSYYEEFINRRELLYANMDLNESDTTGQVNLYQGNVDSIEGVIAKYNEKLNKLNTAKQCIIGRKNAFGASDNYYYSMISSYIASYNYTAQQYENQIDEYQRQIEECEEKINKIRGESDEAVSGNEILAEATTAQLKELERQKESLKTKRDLVKNEETKALVNLELQQISSIEQQISSYEDTIMSLESNLTSAQLQLDTLNGVDVKAQKTVAVLTEKGNVAAEILSYENKLKECETYLKSYDIQNDNCIIKANMTGYFYTAQELKSGSYVQAGTAIGTIYPEAQSKYYAEIYVENTDIAQIKEGQEVKFEIAAYPSGEYGYFEGKVENIAKDISVDQSTGYAYYLVKVRCKDMTLKGKDGEEANLINGMACQAKIVVDEKRVLNYLLEKIDLLD